MKKLFGIICLATVLAGCAPLPPSEYDRWVAECQSRGGFVTVLEGPTWTTSSKMGCIEAVPSLGDFRQ